MEADSKRLQLAIRAATEIAQEQGVLFEQEQLDLCIEARNLCGVVWSIILNQHLDPQKDEWIQTRLGWFRERYYC